MYKNTINIFVVYQKDSKCNQNNTNNINNSSDNTNNSDDNCLSPYEVTVKLLDILEKKGSQPENNNSIINVKIYQDVELINQIIEHVVTRININTTIQQVNKVTSKDIQPA